MFRAPVGLENEPEPTLYELLDDFELSRIFHMFDVEEARPFRIRSYSVCNQNSSTKQNFYPNKTKKRKRRHSVECLDEEYLTQKYLNSQSDKYSDKNTKSNFSFFTQEDEEAPAFLARDIKPPKIYVLGSSRHKIVSKAAGVNRRYRLLQENDSNEHQKKPYSHVDSKLGPYLLQNRQKKANNSYTNTSWSKSAIKHHYMSSNPLTVYKKHKNSSAYLKFSKSLDSRIREDIQINRGPIYFAELNEDNLEAHNKYRKDLDRKDKYLSVYEWLNNMKEKECSHFFTNPFKVSKQVNTDDKLEADDTSEIAELESITSISVLADKKFKIDPFENAKNQLGKEKLPKRLNSCLHPSGFVETNEKQTLAFKKEYKNYLHINKKFTFHNRLPESVQFGKPLIKQEHYITNPLNFASIKEKLKKQRLLNDTILTRMQLDLFIL